MNGQAELPQASRDTHETEPFLDGDLNDLERNGVHGVHRRPPLLIKITGYRILNTALILAFGVPKAVLSYKGELGSATAMDWVMGTVIAIVFVHA
ncbi:hypothetical protein BC834DRAFT_878684 [Gloeopeniophorella convolvens]|nr:hypothetical protein BC834DRAFT_878684 [Gloeopeniophorella convolvens]